MVDRIKVKCDDCKEEFERSVFHPYIKICKKCRKGKKVFTGKKNKEREEKKNVSVVPINTKGFQWLNDGANSNVKVRSCCIASMKDTLETGKWDGIHSECRCGTIFRKLGKYIGLGYGIYAIKNNELVLQRNYLEERRSNG